MIEHKNFALAEFKAAEDSKDPGTFSAIVSVFNNVDDGWIPDRILPGAFAEALAANPEPPVVWSHQWGIPPIGKTLEAKELMPGDALLPESLKDLGGLFMKGQLFINEDEAHPTAKQVHVGLKSGALREFSFGYEVADAREVTEDEETIREIEKIKRLFEWGPTLVGMNPATELIEAASRTYGGFKAGRVLSKVNETKLRDARDAIDAVLSSLEKDDGDKAGDTSTRIDPRVVNLFAKTRYEEVQ